MKLRVSFTYLALANLFLPWAAFGQVPKGQGPTKSPHGYFHRDRQSGMCFLKAHEFNMKEPVKFTVQELWKYHPEDQKWVHVALTNHGDKVISRKERQVYGGDSDQIVQPITNSIGLFWVKWKENDVLIEQFLFSGMLCQDVSIGPERKGDRVATCIPGKDRATATYVPDPEIYCVRNK